MIKFYGYIKDPIRLQDTVFELDIFKYNLALYKSIKGGIFDVKYPLTFTKGKFGFHINFDRYQLSFGKVINISVENAENNLEVFKSSKSVDEIFNNSKEEINK